MRRNFSIRSSLPPEKVLDALRRQSREWRESAVPLPLREHGVHGVQIQIDGSRFRMRTETSTTDRCELRCEGTVTAEATGAVVRGMTRQDNPVLWTMVIVAVIMTLNLAVHPSWAGLAEAAGTLVLIGLVGAGMMVVLRSQVRHNAEAVEFERILEAAAWPPDSSASSRVAV